MTWFLRKSVRFGPLRLNLSRRGVGASVGVKGVRIGVDATGKPYAAGGRGGLYFRERLGGGQPAGKPGPSQLAPPPGVSGNPTPRRSPWWVSWPAIALWAVLAFLGTILVGVVEGLLSASKPRRRRRRW